MSFDHGKMIACGEGGMILTNKIEKYSKYTDNILIMVMQIIQTYQEVVIKELCPALTIETTEPCRS